MNNPSNLPPGVTDAMIEAQLGNEPVAVTLADLNREVQEDWLANYDGAPDARQVRKPADLNEWMEDAMGGKNDPTVPLFTTGTCTIHLNGRDYTLTLAVSTTE